MDERTRVHGVVKLSSKQPVVHERCVVTEGLLDSENMSMNGSSLYANQIMGQITEEKIKPDDITKTGSDVIRSNEFPGAEHSSAPLKASTDVIFRTAVHRKLIES